MTTRRQFIQIIPLTGAALVVGCGEKAAAPPATAAAPAAPAAPAPAAAPATPAPAPATPAPAAAPAAAGALPMLDEKDPTAVALAYVADASRVDKAKSPNFVPGSLCSNCVQYKAEASSEAGPCTIFPGKNVAAKGWCMAYAKKA
jgi:High potential iron-sulfur protein